MRLTKDTLAGVAQLVGALSYSVKGFRFVPWLGHVGDGSQLVFLFLSLPSSLSESNGKNVLE